MSFEQEIKDGQRFTFGANWSRFLRVIDEKRIDEAGESLKRMLAVDSLEGKRFLDAGSGSGLFSLAARRLGADVTSYDLDPQSVACTCELKNRYFSRDESWNVTRGSALDEDFVHGLGQFDVVYSWGVLHHTGAMWRAMDLIATNVAKNGALYLALYNRQEFASSYWLWVKKTYNSVPALRPLFILVHLIYPTLPSILLKTITGRRPERGMTYWYDLLDWLGGYPFEVSKPEEIIDYFYGKGFILTKLKTVGGKLGCNEFVFQRR